MGALELMVRKACGKRRIVIKISAWCASAAMLFCVAGCASIRPDRTQGSLFSWQKSAVIEERRELFSLMKEQNLTVLYQAFSKDLYEEDVADFLEKAAENKIEVYLLTGDPSWALEENRKQLMGEVERASYMGVEGILYDVEPYLLTEWQQEPSAVMDSMAEGMREACKLAHEKDLEVILCIPYYYDTKGLTSQLETLVKDCCDQVAVMNYYRGKEAEHIETESALAKKYGKALITIYELKAPGEHGLIEENTYYGEGLQAARDNFSQLKKVYGEQTLSMAFHDYEALKEVIDHE